MNSKLHEYITAQALQVWALPLQS